MGELLKGLEKGDLSARLLRGRSSVDSMIATCIAQPPWEMEQEWRGRISDHTLETAALVDPY